MNKWLLAALIGALAVLALPALAQAHGYTTGTSVARIYTCGGAVDVAARYMSPNLHGGFLRGNCLSYAGGGAWYVGIRARDGALMLAHEYPYYGQGIRVTYTHQ